MTADARRRLGAVLAVVAVLAGVSVADRVVARPGAPAGSIPATLAVSPVVAGSRASSSAWYCAGLAGAPAGSHASVVLTNPRAVPVTGTLTVRSAGQNSGQQLGFEIPAAAQLSLPLSTPGPASVLIDGGGVGALEVVSGPLGWTTAPCASAAATRWFFAHGSTAPGQTVQLSLFNPTSSDAVVNVSFATSAGGAVTPPAYQGIPVPAGQAVLENLADHVQSNPSFATEVSALSGAVVADEMIEVGSPGHGGMSIVDGSPVTESRWAFAQNTDLQSGGNTFSVFNPSNHPASVTVSISLVQGQAAPIVMQVGPFSVATLAAQDQIRIPSGTTFGLTFSSSGPGIVVSREAEIPSGIAPNLGDVTGAPGGQRRWLVPALPPPGTSPWALAVLNVAGRPIRVKLAWVEPSGVVVAVPGSGVVPLALGGLDLLGPNPPAPIGRAPLVVTADGPVALELDPEPVAAPGTVVVPAWPLVSGG